MAVRSLRRYPVAATIAVLSLAGGIGATTATLIIRDAVFRRPPPLYARPFELSRVQVGAPENPVRPIGNRVPGPLFAQWRRDLPMVPFAAAVDGRIVEIRTPDRSEMAPLREVTPDFFPVVGVDAAIGRTFAGPLADSTVPPAVLSYRLWQTLFDGRADAVGATVWIGRQAYAVIGVMPERFWFSSMDAPIWTRLDAAALDGEIAVEVIARRPAGMTHGRFEQQLEPALKEYASRLPMAERQLYLYVSGIEGTPIGRMMALFVPWLLGASVLLTLFIACANVAILVIAQWTAREQETAIRASLGASRARVVRALVTESVVMALAGGVLGVLATFALRGYIVSRVGASAVMFDLSVSPMILLLSAAIAILSGAFAGIGPALLETRRLHGNPLRMMQSSDRVRQRWRHTLVVLEIAITVALLVVSTTMVNSYRRHLSFNPGFATAPLATIRVEQAGGVNITEILDILKRTPGVAAAAASTTIPYTGFGGRQRIAPDASGSTSFMAEVGSISADFFGTLGVSMRAGRAFTPHDTPDLRVTILSETMTRRVFGTRDPVGQRLWISNQPHDVVGVVADYANGTFQSPERLARAFVPLASGKTTREEVPFLIRGNSDPVALLDTFRRAVQQEQAGSLVTRGLTIEQAMTFGGREMLAATAPLMPLVATGLFLTAVGIYGVLAFTVTRRSRELALRLAIGATRADLRRFVAAESVRLIVIGTMFGVGATFGLSQIGRAAGGGGSMMDPNWVSFLTPVVIIAVIAALATWIPLRRALRLDPSVLLRA